ncbi:MAG TPA: SBBP repeat-containing protein, partial [Thermoanaerobaculia bacterium]|nr:SBBP repeat-containing protein [Thermoanaerobaculia bacterium]
RHVLALAVFVIASARAVSAASPAKLETLFGKLPLTFEANRGQLDSRVKFVGRGAASSFFLTRQEAVLDLRDAVVRMRFVGANRAAAISGIDQLPGHSNYYRTHGARGASSMRALHVVSSVENIPQYSAVRYGAVYPGVDVVYRGNQRELEYDIIVAPDADPSIVRLSFDGVDRLEMDGDDVVLHARGREVRQRRPVIYQDVDGVRRNVHGRYVIAGRRQLTFAVGKYDRKRPLVIDPVVSFGTYIGGSGSDTAQAIAVDSSGNIYITGQTQSNDFPVVIAGGDPIPAGSNYLLFVAKLNSTGTTLLYSDWFADDLTSFNIGNAIKVDASGNAFVTGQYSVSGFSNVIVLRLNASGAKTFAGVFGGSGETAGYGIAIDGTGDAYVTGLVDAGASAPPNTTGFQGTPGGDGDAFVEKVNTNLAPGSSVVYFSYLGGSLTDQGNAIAIDGSGNAYVAGSTFSSNFPFTSGAYQKVYGGDLSDAFFAKVSADGKSLMYSTLFGGAAFDAAYALAVDAAGNGYIVGYVNGNGLPTTAAAYQTAWNVGDCRNTATDPATPCGDAFVAKFNPAASGAASLIYSTYLGGPGGEVGSAISLDSAGDAFVAGSTRLAYSPAGSFPTVNPLAGYNSADTGFIAELNTSGSALIFSSYYQSAIKGLVFDGSGNLYVTGDTFSTTGIATTGTYQTMNRGADDGFIAKISGFAVPPSITAQPQSQTINLNQAASMNVAATGTSLTYQWYLGISGTTSSPVGGATSTSYTTPALINTTRYWVRVTGSSGSSDSNTATITIAFTDDPLTSGVSVVRAVHITELQTRINGLRARYSLGATTFSAVSAGVKIQAQHIVELRNSLAQVYMAASRTAPAYTTDPSLATGTPIRKNHIAELRAAVVAIE